MTDVDRLLAEATPLPWRAGMRQLGTRRQNVSDRGTPVWDSYVEAGVREYQIVTPDDSPTFAPDALLIVYAVNHLPAYEAAVEALERIQQKMSDWQDETQKAGVYRDGDPDQRMAKWVHDEAFTVLRRLRDEVPV